MTSTLFEIQTKFSEILRSKDLNPEDLESIFTQSRTSEVPLPTRLGIYHFAYFERIKESLAEDFPKIKAQIGDHDFDQLIRDYLEKYPSRYPNLAQAGKNLPKFLAESLQYAHHAGLQELADQEWAHCLCKWSESSQPMDFSKLLELSEEEQLDQSLILAPSAQFLKGQVIFKVSIGNSSHSVKTLELTPSMEKLLDEIRKGHGLGELTRFLEGDSELATMTWISNWVATGLITGFQPKKPF